MVVTEIADRSGESAVPLGLLTFNTEGSVRTAYAAHRIQWALCVRLFFLSRFGGWRRSAFEGEVTGSARSMSMINDAPRFEAETFDIKDQKAAAVVAQKASTILSDASAGVSDTQMATRFQEALRSREVVSLAKGIIMARDGSDPVEAFSTLLHLSLADGVPLLQRAAAIVHSAVKREIEPGPASR